MWHTEFGERLRGWKDLRDRSSKLELGPALMDINDWWWQAPMINHSLHWKDFPDWPDPWTLLGQSGFCDLARALGMLYTVEMSDRIDVETMMLIETRENNLVLINTDKYIMNWSPGVIVNNLSPAIKINRSIPALALIKSLR